jgi:hypothetical protein
MTTFKRFFFLLACLLASGASPAQAQRAAISSPHVADYDAELRRPDGRVDTEAMTQRLKDLGITTYYWLIAHAATDWEDLQLFLPKAAQAHIQVWVYLVPPSESAPREGNLYPEPFRLDYLRWAEEIGRLSLQHTNLTGWVIDDFYENHQLFTPAYVGEMQKRAKRLNPRLAFLPLMYFGEINRRFVEDYRKVIDGVVVAYPQGRDEIEDAWAILNDLALANPGELSFPNYTPSQLGDFVMASTTAAVVSDRSADVSSASAARTQTGGRDIRAPMNSRQRLRFRERDDYTGPTAGYHFKQLLLDGVVVWEQDVAGGTNAWQDVSLDISDQLRGKTHVTVAFRLLDKQGVGNFGVRWQLADLRADGLQLGANLSEPQKWEAARQGPFEAGFGRSLRKSGRQFHVPFIVMTAAQNIEFRLRHGDLASPERIASWLRMCLQTWRAGQCDGVVTYCLDKGPQSPVFPLAQALFKEFGGGQE